MEIVETWSSETRPLVFSSTHYTFKYKANFLGLALHFTKIIPLETYLSEIGRFIAKSCILGKFGFTSRN
jgi:hypothetical protein